MRFLEESLREELDGAWAARRLPTGVVGAAEVVRKTTRLD